DDTPFDIAILSDPAELGSVPEIAEDYDLVFIDTPGSRSEQKLVAAYLEVSDFILVSSEVDGLSLEPADRYINELVVPAKKPYSVLLTKVDSRSPEQETAAREFFAEANQPVFKSAIHLFRAFPYAYQDGVFVSAGTSRRANGRNAASADHAAALELLSAIRTLCPDDTRSHPCPSKRRCARPSARTTGRSPPPPRRRPPPALPRRPPPPPPTT